MSSVVASSEENSTFPIKIRDRDDEKSRWTKVTVKELPPGLKKELFVKSLDDFMPSICYLRYIPGSVKYKGLEKQTSNSKAFISFNSPEDVLKFKEQYEGKKFIDDNGKDFKIRIEFSPLQRSSTPCSLPMTIEKDKDYIQFLELIKTPKKPILSAEAQLEQRLQEEKKRLASNGGKEPPISTPLLDYLKKKPTLQLPKPKLVKKEELLKQKKIKQKQTSGTTVEPTQPPPPPPPLIQKSKLRIISKASVTGVKSSPSPSSSPKSPAQQTTSPSSTASPGASTAGPGKKAKTRKIVRTGAGTTNSAAAGSVAGGVSSPAVASITKKASESVPRPKQKKSSGNGGGGGGGGATPQKTMWSRKESASQVSYPHLSQIEIEIIQLTPENPSS